MDQGDKGMMLVCKMLTIHIMFHVAKLSIHFPTKGGVSKGIALNTIVMGETSDCKKHLSLQIEQCCQVHKEDAPCNSQMP